MYQNSGNTNGAQYVEQPKKKGDNRKVLTVVCGVCVALGVGALGVSGYNLSQAAALNAQMTSNTKEVVVPLADVPARSDLNISGFTIEQVPVKYVPADAVTSLEDLEDSQSIANLTAGVPVSASAIQGASESGDLTASIKDEKVAVMVQVDEASVLSPLMHVGDIVDVYAVVSDGLVSTTEKVAEGVKIVALDGQTTGSLEGYSKVTLELDDEQALAVQANANSIRLAANPRVEALDAANADSQATQNVAGGNAVKGGIDVQ